MRTAIAACVSLIWLSAAAQADLVELGDLVPGRFGATYCDPMNPQ